MILLPKTVIIKQSPLSDTFFINFLLGTMAEEEKDKVQRKHIALPSYFIYIYV